MKALVGNKLAYNQTVLTFNDPKKIRFWKTLWE